MGAGGQPHAPAACTPGKGPVPILQEAECLPGPVWTGAENIIPTGIRSRTVQPVAQSLIPTELPVPQKYFKFHVKVAWWWSNDLNFLPIK